MRDTINAFFNEITRQRAKRRRMGAVIAAMSLVVAIGVLWQMKITGITMTGEALCGHGEHIHSEACELVLTCGQEEVPGHTHSEECYSCTREEHTHTVLCYSDREADLESEKVWKATLPELGDNYAQNTVDVALSQVGCAESLRNYEVSPEGEQRGYSRYGAWYGNPYGNWSAMFASFCLHYAEHPAYEALKNSGPETMRLQVEAALCYAARDSYAPVAGDLVFLDRDGSGSAEAVAVVVRRDGDAVTIVEGDYEDAVVELTLEITDPEIMGWAVLSAPEAAEDYVAEGIGDGEPEEVGGDITITFQIGEEVVKTIKAPAGKSLRDLMDEDPTFENPWPVDPMPGNEGETFLGWFREGERLTYETVLSADAAYAARFGEPLDLDIAITDDPAAEIFYRIQLIRNPVQTTGVEVDGSGSLTLILREGERPRAEDFLVDGVDYRLCTWFKADGTEVDLNSIIANGVTENITATIRTEPKCFRDADIKFYVYVDNERKLVSHDTIKVYSDTARWLIPAGTLEEIYGGYGFRAEDLKAGDRFFPHTVRDSGTIWADAAAKDFHGVVCVQTVSDDNSIDLYYLPNQTLWDHTGWDDPNMKAANTFWSVKVADEDGVIYNENTLPKAQYILKGGSTTVVVLAPPNGSAYSWVTTEPGVVPVCNAANQTYTFTFENINKPIEVYLWDPNAETEYTIEYNVSNQNSSIQGGQILTEGPVTVSNQNAILVKAPDVTEFSVDATSTNGCWFIHTFEGWMVNGDPNKVIPAGQVEGADFRKYAGPDQEVTLTAVWKNQGRTGSCSFYVNLDFTILNYGGAGGSMNAENFTPAVYATKAEVTPTPEFRDYSDVILGETNGSAYAVDQAIRSLPNGVTVSSENDSDALKFPKNEAGNITFPEGTYTFTLGSFPKDEEILRSVRTLQEGWIRDYKAWCGAKGEDADTSIDAYRAENKDKHRIVADSGQYVPADRITEENFAVRWYVFKLEGNCWHVDGILVKKMGKLTVTKDFSGDQGAIDEVEKAFSIVAEQREDGQWKYIKTMKTSTDPAAESLAPISHEGNSYTWVMDVMSDAEIRLTEHDYVSEKENIISVSEYMVDNEDEVKRTGYEGDKGVVVTTRAYSVDTNYQSYKTVKFYNSYVPKGSVFINKVGSSSVPIPGVKFALFDGNGTQLTVYQSAPGSCHLTQDEDKTWTETNELVTDDQGNIVIEILDGEHSAGEYSLKEVETRPGYNRIDDVKFTINGDGELTGVDGGGSVIQDDKGNNIGIKVVNDSEKLNVTVKKEWLDGTNEAVKVTLYRSKTELTGKDKNDRPFQNYELNESNNWTVTWEDLPANVGGQSAVYSVRESWIGDVAYSGELAVNGGDGYKDYVVTYDDAKYAKDEADKVVEIILGVKNQRDTGGFSFPKVDGETNRVLAGAEFKLYKDAACTVEYKTAASGVDGIVNFGTIPFGTCYMKETSAPAGYQRNETVYEVKVGTTTVIEIYNEPGDPFTGPLEMIPNLPICTELQVKKVGENNQALTGAKFQLWKKQSNGTYAIVKDLHGNLNYSVDSHGELTLGRLHGEYFLREVSAPDGYYRLAEDFCFTSANGTITAAKGEGLTGWKLETTGDSAVFTLTVTNVPGSELPSTGGMGTSLFYGLGFVLMVGAVWVLVTKKRLGVN